MSVKYIPVFIDVYLVAIILLTLNQLTLVVFDDNAVTSDSEN